MSADPTTQLKILLVDDSSADIDLIDECLKRSELSHEILVAKNLADGLKRLEYDAFGVILLNLELPDSKGIGTLLTISEVSGDAVILVLTDADEEQLSTQAIQAGAQDTLPKGELSSKTLRRAINYALARTNKLEQSKATVHAPFDTIKYRESLLHRILNANSDAMLVLSPEHEIKFLNASAGQILEADPDRLLGEIFPFEVRGNEHSKLEIPGPNNSTSLFELSTIDLTWEGKSALLVTLRDITPYHLAEVLLKNEQQRLCITLDSIADAVIATDVNDSIQLINQEASRLTGVNQHDAFGKPLSEVFTLRHPISGKILQNLAQLEASRDQTNTRAENSICLVRSVGGDILVTAATHPIPDHQGNKNGTIVVFRDMTQQKQAEDEIFKSEKLQSISLLAGGIAHDFNNILSAILGNISMVRMALDDNDTNASKLLAAENATLQAKSLTQQLLAFSKGGTPILESTTISQLVQDCADFILRGSNVKCEINNAPGLWPVDADKGQIGQVVNNLLINADQSMPNGGTITVTLKNKTIPAKPTPALDPGDYVCIKIADRGTGISANNLKRIFDPYFTTKVEGHGLGLASSYSIIKNHKGLLTATSVLGEGSTFMIFLPRSTQIPKPERTPAEQTTENHSIHQGQGRILVMDDMEAMMTVAGEILSVLGYEVEFSTNGKEAIDAYKAAKEAGKPFDAVVFDLTVPGGMGGEEAAHILLDYDPNLIAIASSGYSTSNVMSDYKDSPFNAVVPKPYRIKEMSDALKRALQ